MTTAISKREMQHNTEDSSALAGLAQATILVVDSDNHTPHLIKAACEETPEVVHAASFQKCLTILEKHHPDVILLDVVLPDANGLEALGRIRQIAPKVPVIFITASESSNAAIEGMKLGAIDYLIKPLDFAKVQEVIKQALEIRRWVSIPVQIHEAESDDVSGDVLVGNSPQMHEVYKAIGRVASQDVAVLVRGESGCGKELVARAIYHHSRRLHGMFLAVNCAALSESLLESELFGHEKGAFTGAACRRIGKFEQCSGGTLFLDEIGDMSPSVQSKVLRVLHEQRFERVGGTETIETDVRVIAATNRDLERMVAANEFRQDLYYRLNGFTIMLTPLRMRKDDLLTLLGRFLHRISRQLGKEVQGISPDALERLLSYDWPGNVRQLQNVLRHAILKATGPVIITDFLPPEVVSEAAANAALLADNSVASEFRQFIEQRLHMHSQNLLAESTEQMERILVIAVMRATDGNQSQAAKILGITRGSVRKKINDLGISIHSHVGISADAVEGSMPDE